MEKYYTQGTVLKAGPDSEDIILDSELMAQRDENLSAGKG
jgi:hypothetical protein